jgi:exosortase/archaeosortase family protein
MVAKPGLFLQVQGPSALAVVCSGLELFLLFFGFILLMKGRLKDKLWFVPLGFLGILVLNIIRIILLSIIYYHTPQYLDFNHKYTFVIIVYGAIFGLWVLWVNKFANRAMIHSSKRYLFVLPLLFILALSYWRYTYIINPNFQGDPVLLNYRRTLLHWGPIL